jgi:prephenate dehydrogenase
MISAGIIGFGRFGELFKKHLSGHFSFVTYRRSMPEHEIAAALEQLQHCDYIFFSVPISAMEVSSQTVKKYIKPNATLVDLCSVKEYPIEVLERYFPENEIIGAHPLFGPESAADGFAGHQIITVKPKHDSPKYAKLKAIWESMQVSVIEMSAAEHDRQMAWTLCLTQFIGRGLSTLPLPENSIGTKGYFDLLAIVRRAEADTIQLFNDMNLHNRYSSEMRNAVVERFAQLNEQFPKN